MSDNDMIDVIDNNYVKREMFIYILTPFLSVDITHYRQTLTHCGLETPYGGRDLGQHWFR